VAATLEKKSNRDGKRNGSCSRVMPNTKHGLEVHLMVRRLGTCKDQDAHCNFWKEKRESGGEKEKRDPEKAIRDISQIYYATKEGLLGTFQRHARAVAGQRGGEKRGENKKKKRGSDLSLKEGGPQGKKVRPYRINCFLGGGRTWQGVHTSAGNLLKKKGVAACKL